MVTSDLVEDWKQLARARMQHERCSKVRPELPRIDISYGFVPLALVIGARFGVVSSPTVLVLLAAVLLAHELPGALLAYALGRSAEVQLSERGAFTRVRPALTGMRVLGMATVGSMVNLFAAAFGIALWRTGLPREAAALIELWTWSHAAWALGQVLPIVPFRVGRAISQRLSPPFRLLHASLSGALLIAVTVITADRHRWPALFPLAALCAVSALLEAFRALGESSDLQNGAPDLAARAEQHLRDCDTAGAAALAERGLSLARSASVCADLNTILAWVAIASRDPVAAHFTLARLPPSALDYHLVAAYLGCCNRDDEAIALLREARDLGLRDPESTKLLIDLLYRSGETAGAAAVARADRGLLSAEDYRVIECLLPGHAG